MKARSMPAAFLLAVHNAIRGDQRVHHGEESLSFYTLDDLQQVEEDAFVACYRDVFSDAGARSGEKREVRFGYRANGETVIQWLELELE